MTIPMAWEAREPMNAVGEAVEHWITDKLVERLNEIAEAIRNKELQPDADSLVAMLRMSAGYAATMLLESRARRAVRVRRQLREALALTEAHDAVAEDLHALSRALRRRETYWLIRHAAALVEHDDPAAAATLQDYAVRHEPADDGMEFAAKRRPRWNR